MSVATSPVTFFLTGTSLFPGGLFRATPPLVSPSRSLTHTHTCAVAREDKSNTHELRASPGSGTPTKTLHEYDAQMSSSCPVEEAKSFGFPKAKQRLRRNHGKFRSDAEFFGVPQGQKQKEQTLFHSTETRYTTAPAAGSAA